MNIKTITLEFSLEQVANDILTKCNLISKAIRDEAMEDIRADILTPDSPETRSIINRAITEAFGNVKSQCKNYLNTGRTEDDNMLERMVSEVVYQKDGQGNTTDVIDHLVYETITLVLEIENFNTSVTDALKSSIHRYVVDYALASFLEDQYPDKALYYKRKADGDPTDKGLKSDKELIRENLNAREKFNVRKPSWI